MTPYAKTLFTIIIIFAVLVGGAFYFKKYSHEIPVTVDNSSLVGCYVAHLSNDVYTLRIVSVEGTAVKGTLEFKNFEKDSSFGDFVGSFTDGILVGEYTFESEGMSSVRQVIFKKGGDTFTEGFGPTVMVGDKETFSDLHSVTYDSKSVFVKSSTCDSPVSFSDSKHVFTISYNPRFVLTEGTAKVSKEWMQNAKYPGVLLATVTALRSYMPHTNFSEARLTIGRSTDGNAIKECISEKGFTGTVSLVTIDGVSFKLFSSADAGAGNRYDTKSYRAINDGDCYVIEYTIHSTNIDNYSPDQGVNEFDKDSITSEMDAIVHSFKFLIKSN